MMICEFIKLKIGKIKKYLKIKEVERKKLKLIRQISICCNDFMGTTYVGKRIFIDSKNDDKPFTSGAPFQMSFEKENHFIGILSQDGFQFVTIYRLKPKTKIVLSFTDFSRKKPPTDVVCMASNHILIDTLKAIDRFHLHSGQYWEALKD